MKSKLITFLAGFFLAVALAVFAADITINDLIEATAPASNDEVELQLASGGASRKSTIANLGKGLDSGNIPVGYSAQNYTATAATIDGHLEGIDQNLTFISGQEVSFRVHKNGTHQTLPSSIRTKITWSTETYDNGDVFDLANDEVVIRKAGRYSFTCHLTFSVLSDGVVNYAELLVNGVTDYQGIRTSAGNASFGGTMVSRELDMSVGDTVACRGFHLEGANEDVLGALHTSTFFGHLISSGGLQLGITDWVDVTFAGSSWSTNTTITGKAKDYGSERCYKFNVSISGPIGTPGGLSIDLPSGDVIDTSQLINAEDWGEDIGDLHYEDESGGWYPGDVYYSDTNTIKLASIRTSGNYAGVPTLTHAVPVASPGAGDRIVGKFCVPLQQSS